MTEFFLILGGAVAGFVLHAMLSANDTSRLYDRIAELVKENERLSELIAKYAQRRK